MGRPMNLAGGAFVSSGWSLAGHLTHIWLPPLHVLQENHPHQSSISMVPPGASWCILVHPVASWCLLVPAYN